MTQIIKIDRKTIKRNPHAGQTDYLVPGPSYTEFSFSSCNAMIETIVAKLEEKEVLRVVGHRLSFDENNVMERFYEAMSDMGGDELKKILNKVGINNAQIIQHSNPQRIRSLIPEPDYLYSYKPTKVKCQSCGKKVYPEDLLADAVPQGDGEEAWSNEICPKCGAWDAFDFKHEILTEGGFKKWAEKNSQK